MVGSLHSPLAQPLLPDRPGALRAGSAEPTRSSTGGQILRSYELMMIHRPELTETDVRTLVGEVESVIAASGSVTDTDFWGKRRFAYEIDHLHEGFYSVLAFESGTEMVETLDRALGLHDAVVRHKITRVGAK
ncbi:MAG: 30S ribosomal protein S6 [Acidimicrobiia bacterium]|nr:30S ribosomal protein S6 [Acidimicrobiia bacterium]